MVFFNPGYPVGSNFKEYDNVDGKSNWYEIIRNKIKGCKIFQSVPFKGYGIFRDDDF